MNKKYKIKIARASTYKDPQVPGAFREYKSNFVDFDDEFSFDDEWTIYLENPLDLLEVHPELVVRKFREEYAGEIKDYDLEIIIYDDYVE